MDIGKSIQFVFDDNRWTSKLGLGALISMVPILNFAWMGYTIEIMRNVTESRELPLPEWDEIGDKFFKGLLVSVAMFIYALPGLIFLCLPIGIMIFPAFIQNQDAQGPVAAATTAAGLALFCCIGLYFLAFTFIVPAVQLRFSRVGTFQSCFQLREISQMISTKLSGYLTAWLFAIAAGFVVGILVAVISGVLGWIPCLGQILAWIASAIASVWLGAVFAHIFGQFGALSVGDQDALAAVSGLEV